MYSLNVNPKISKLMTNKQNYFPREKHTTMNHMVINLNMIRLQLNMCAVLIKKNVTCLLNLNLIQAFNPVPEKKIDELVHTILSSTTREVTPNSTPMEMIEAILDELYYVRPVSLPLLCLHARHISMNEHLSM